MSFNMSCNNVCMHVGNLFNIFNIMFIMLSYIISDADSFQRCGGKGGTGNCGREPHCFAEVKNQGSCQVGSRPDESSRHLLHRLHQSLHQAIGRTF